MLLNVTLKCIQFRDNLILLQLLKRGATAFVSAIPRQDVSFSPLSLLNFFLQLSSGNSMGSLDHIDTNCETKSVLLLLSWPMICRLVFLCKGFCPSIFVR